MWYCECCEMATGLKDIMDQHIKSSKHKSEKKLDKYRQKREHVTDDDQKEYILSTIIKYYLRDHNVKKHHYSTLAKEIKEVFTIDNIKII